MVNGRTMDYTQIKNVQMSEYLRSIGCNPTKVQYGSAWYLSPFRQERTASFKVNLSKNLWYDFGAGEGGTLVDFVMKMNRLDFSGAIAQIGSGSFSYTKHYDYPQDDGTGRIKIEQLQPLSHPALMQYLSRRRIPLQIARMYLHQAHYSVHNRKYFALAFPNDKGGYELRNAFFKTGSSPKYFTTIPGKDETRISLFEGFMDFLSCCSYYGRSPKGRTVILNSLSFLQRLDPTLGEFRSIHLYLDNDPAGREATRRLMDRFGQAKDLAEVLYPGYKDFNEYWMK